MLELITGPMMSGKTTELLRRLERHQIAGADVCLFRPASDSRDKLTHTAREHNIRVVATDEAKLSDEAQRFDVVGIDEVQFFPPSTASFLNESANARHVIVSGINATSELGPWDTVQALIPFCDDITYMHAVCVRCGNQYASKSYFAAGDKHEQVIVGGADKYVALCRNCYYTG